MKKKRFYNTVLSLFLCIILVFTATFQPKKTHAIAPALIWVAEALIAEVAIDLGWKYVGKPAFEKIKKKLGKKITDNVDHFDFPKKKVKKSGKRIDIDISPLDRQKVAKMLKDEGAEVIIKDKERQKVTKPKYEVDFPDTDPFYNSGIELEFKPYETSLDLKGIDLIRKLYTIEFTPVAFEQASRIRFISSITNQEHYSGKWSGGTPYKELSVVVRYQSTGVRIFADSYYDAKTLLDKSDVEWKLYHAYITQLEQNNRTIYLAEGLIVPSDNTKIYNVPINAPSNTKLPNSIDLDFDISIPIDDSEDNTYIEIDYDQLINYETEINEYITNIINEGDTTITNNYYITVNNYYTDEPYDDKVDDVVIPDNPDNDDDDDGDSWFKNLIPIVALIAVFDLLTSILMYLTRMFTFILTIPIIEAKPIDNSAFHWFKSARIMGVQIYEIVSLMATVGLSFAVYKAVRRFFE